MIFISFFYKIENDPRIYYGKYYSDDKIFEEHDGLDLIVEDIVLFGLNKFRKQKNFLELKSNNIYIGILSISDDKIMPINSSQKEINFFNFYYVNNKIYVNGNLVWD
jgi:hypothetical protein